MAPSWFPILLLKCFDFLSWPVLALGYPLCASIEAIESDNHSETRNLMSYWILLSLIYLFEYAFLKLLQWFQYWHYMKLMMVVFLVTPDFGRAAYVYNRLIRSCINMNPQAVISSFRNWNNIFLKKQDFMMQAEKYISQNGTEALEKLIASKNTEQSLLHAETRKAIPITTVKNEILKQNKGRLLMEQTDIKDLEMIEKEEVPEGKQTEVMAAKYTEGGSSPSISASKNFQKEWTCAICQVTTPSEADLNLHLHGRLHKAACEALQAKDLSADVKVFVKKKDDKPGGEPEKMINNNAWDSLEEQKITPCLQPKIERKNVKVQKYYYRPKSTTGQENMCKSVHVISKVQELKNYSGVLDAKPIGPG